MYKKIDLKYSFDSLEPYIDKETMQIHYEKHLGGYEVKLNKRLENTDLFNKYPTLLSLMENYQKINNEDEKVAIRQFGGGLINHNFFFSNLKQNTVLNGKLKDKIITDFGSEEKFIEEFVNFSMAVFGSGWTWLVRKQDGKLGFIKVFNQDNPWFLGFTPILGVDLWEHAYYLKYKNDRKSYLNNFLKVIDWDMANDNYLEIEKKTQ